MLNAKFFWGTIRKSIIAFGNLFNNIHIDRKDSTGNVIQTVTPVIESQPIVSSVVANTTAKTIVNAVSVTSTSFTLMVSDDLGSGNSMKDVEFNISFRYV